MTARRNPRGKVENCWVKRDGTPSARSGKGKQWRARYVDAHGKEHERYFDRKADANRWLDQQTAAVVDGRHVAPKDAKITVSEWCDTWFQGYGGRPGTRVNAQGVIRYIVDEFGGLPLSEVRPSQVKTWTAKLSAEGMADSTVRVMYGYLRQILGDAVLDGLLGSNPCSRRTTPPAGQPKMYLITTEQFRALYNAVPDHLRAAIVLGGLAGLRVGEVCGLRVTDVDFMRGIVHPRQQYGDAPLKTLGSDAPVFISRDTANVLAASVQKYGTEWVVTNGRGGPASLSSVKRAIRDVRGDIEGMPEGFSSHDLRHYFASAQIAKGMDVLKVCKQMRHANPSITLKVYAKLWPNADDSIKATMNEIHADIFSDRPAEDVDRGRNR